MKLLSNRKYHTSKGAAKSQRPIANGQPMIFVLLALLMWSCGSGSSQAQEVKRINNDELMGMLPNADLQLIDVRTPQEVSAGQIAGARNIDYSSRDFMTELGKLDREKPVAVYCAVGGRSARAAQALKELGFRQIYDLEGGIRNWSAQGLPVVKP